MADGSTPMRGFTCAISHARASAGPARIACGLDDNGHDVRIALSLSHADGTTLVAYLSEEGIGRLADRLALLIAAAPFVAQAPAGVTVQ